MQEEDSIQGYLHKLLLQCWDEGTSPQDMRDAKTITLYKNKGNLRDCNNYRGISTLSTVGKVLAQVVLYLWHLRGHANTINSIRLGELPCQCLPDWLETLTCGGFAEGWVGGSNTKSPQDLP
ncbi:hypothetical protein ElyMa_005356600 [Elysia marginata]|uniref:Uncharacterized protein n=1 Tax=Elysia marginata TaxID=1093978 RepID=A0AAV4EC80_9GAST|nr:hypothetical protein ElyMa_005356600 [Elysia marginata]